MQPSRLALGYATRVFERVVTPIAVAIVIACVVWLDHSRKHDGIERHKAVRTIALWCMIPASVCIAAFMLLQCGCCDRLSRARWEYDVLASRMARDGQLNAQQAEAIVQRLQKDMSAFLAVLRPAIRMQLRVTTDEQLPIGATKVGGNPDVPSRIAWPAEVRRQAADRRLPSNAFTFVAQVQLARLHAELAGMARRALPEGIDQAAAAAHVRRIADAIPREGWLHFFVPASCLAWKQHDFEPVAGSSVVLHTLAGLSELERRESPWRIIADTVREPYIEAAGLVLDNEDIVRQFRPCTIRFCSEWALPSGTAKAGTWLRTKAGLEVDEYNAVTQPEADDDEPPEPALQGGNSWSRRPRPLHKLYGWPDMFSSSAPAPDMDGDDPAILLLQIDSDPTAHGSSLGPRGRLQWFIRLSALRDARWSEAWVLYSTPSS